MTLYNSALAPAIPKADDGTTVDALTAADYHVDTSDTYTDAAINAAIDLLVAQMNALIEHLNNGRESPF